MNRDGSMVMCERCGQEVEFEIRIKKETRNINNEEFEFDAKEAVCERCGGVVTVPWVQDENERHFEHQYRRSNDYILVDEINEIIEKYDIEKRPLSRVLGMGEHTIERYLEGQLPNKKYSDELRRIRGDYSYMQKYYEAFSSKLTPKASQKLGDRLDYYRKINSVQTILDAVAHYVLSSKYEMNNLYLQKILYYVDGFAEIFLEKAIYEAPCEARRSGPVYRPIYDKYIEFGGEPICVDGADYGEHLQDELVRVVDYVLDNFAIYNGTILMEFTHGEGPWREAREGYFDDEACDKVIPHERIRDYFLRMDEKYNLREKKGVRKYVEAMMK